MNQIKIVILSLACVAGIVACDVPPEDQGQVIAPAVAASPDGGQALALHEAYAGYGFGGFFPPPIRPISRPIGVDPNECEITYEQCVSQARVACLGFPIACVGALEACRRSLQECVTPPFQPEP